ncbi:MAG: putative transposase [Bacteroidia bacterium]
MGYSRQAYYKQIRSRSEWLIKKQKILESVNEIRKELPKTGTIKIMEHCQEYWMSQGIKIGRDKTFNLLRENGMLQRRRKRYKPQTTWSNHWLRKHPDLIKHSTFDRPNQLWVSDITYLPMGKGWCYLFLTTDAVSRKVVGYHVSRRLDASSALKALSMAITENPVRDRLIHHSDRGVQYCSHSYVKKLNQHDIKISMTQSGSPYDNAIAERINGILKHELIFPFGDLNSIEEVKNRVKHAIASYNHLRLHQSIGY